MMTRIMITMMIMIIS